MGIDLEVVCLAWRGNGLPDWRAIERDARHISDSNAEGIADWLFIWDDLEQLEEDEFEDLLEEEPETGPRRALWFARKAAGAAVRSVEQLVTEGDSAFTLVQVPGWSAVLVGGASTGEDPDPDWDDWVVVSRSGLLSPSAAHAGLVDGPDVSWPRIYETPTLLPILIDPDVDWEAIGQTAGDEQRDWVDEMSAAAADRYSRWAEQRQIGDSTLIVVDRWFARNALEELRLTGALDLLGTVLEDPRLVETGSELPHPIRLRRFRLVQNDQRRYEVAVAELRRGRKLGHWMWFVFPQVLGLGESSMASRYAITSLSEATAFLDDPVLGPRLIECARILVQLDGLTAEEIFGEIDALKLRSSMTLFALASRDETLFRDVLAKYFDGVPDDATERILQAQR